MLGMPWIIHPFHKPILAGTWWDRVKMEFLEYLAVTLINEGISPDLLPTKANSCPISGRYKIIQRKKNHLIADDCSHFGLIKQQSQTNSRKLIWLSCCISRLITDWLSIPNAPIPNWFTTVLKWIVSRDFDIKRPRLQPKIPVPSMTLKGEEGCAKYLPRCV